MGRSTTEATRLFALLGYPVEHSISPFIQNGLFAANKLDCRYVALAVPPETLAQAVIAMRHDYGGFNVTIPHKQAVMEFLDEIDPQARLYGAVNTVRNKDGRLLGYNTDGDGFIRGFAEMGITVKKNKVLMLGAGGAARAVLCELLRRSCDVTLVNRTAERARLLVDSLVNSLPGSAVVCKLTEVSGAFDFLVNTTSVGMGSNDMLPVDPSLLDKVRVVYDLVYNPYETKLLTEAKKRGCMTLNGFPMLFYQAVAANAIWTGQALDSLTERQLFREAEAYLLEMQQC